ncbi:MAG: protease modulator HflC [Spirochaetota bacterium]
MKKLVTILVVIAVVVIVFLILGPFFIVQEGEQAVVIRFGEIVKTTDDAGLKIKTPFVDNVVKYPERTMSWDGQPRLFPTAEQQFIYVDTTARWRIVDPESFYQRLITVNQAYALLDDVLESAVANIIAQNQIHEAVRSTNIINDLDRGDAPIPDTAEEVEGIEQIADLIVTVEEQDPVQKGREVLSREMLERAGAEVEDWGIELVDVVIRQIRYSEELTESVYDRMVSERMRIARAYRSLGEGRKEQILGELEREKNRILSTAFATAEDIRGQADATAARTYSDAYSQDEGFFEFWRAVESYRDTLPRFRKTLTTDLDYFDYLYSESGQ